jgi:hypothetical protein
MEEGYPAARTATPAQGHHPQGNRGPVQDADGLPWTEILAEATAAAAVGIQAQLAPRPVRIGMERQRPLGANSGAIPATPAPDRVDGGCHYQRVPGSGGEILAWWHKGGILGESRHRLSRVGEC